MLCLKKLYTDDLLQLALLLSLLRVDPNSYLGLDVPAYNVGSLDLGNMSGWFMDSPIIRPQYVHPKNLDNMLLNYERQMFEDLNALGRFNRVQNYNVTAYLLNVDQDRDYQNMTIGLNSTASAIEPTASALVPSNRSLNILDVVTDSADAVAESEATEEAASTIKIEPDDSDTFDNEELSLNHPPDPFNTAELTQEDMDLIEVLWKQDVDLGFSLEANAQNITDTVSVKSEQGSTGSGYRVSNSTQKPTISNALSTTSSQNADEEKLKALEAINSKQLKSEDPEDGEDGLDPWARFSYTIDTETGEYVLKSGLGPNLPPEEDTADDLPLDGTLAEFLLEEALQLVGLDDDCPQDVASAKEVESSQSSPSSQPEASIQEAASSDNAAGFTDPDDDEILKMIQTAQFHHGHPRAFQGHMPFMHMNMEQHWQDLANLLSLPAGESAAAASAHHAHHALSAAHHAHHAAAAHALHHHHGYGHVHHAHPVGYGTAPPAPDTRGVLLHNATLAPPVGDLNSTTPYHNNLGGTNLGSAVATSMNLTNSSEPINDSGTPSYKLENPHDMMYYPNTSSEINSTSDGFLSSILNDEDLQLMDMAMNEGMYTMRMLDGGNSTLGNAGASSASNRVSTDLATALTAERMDASSDSAVSSMGSERVPSLSDGEWCDAASDSGHTTADHYALDYASGYSNKYRPYDYSYNSRQHSNNIVSSDSRRMPAVAQKKHQMFGKRFFQEQGGATSLLPSSVPVKYEYPEVGATSSFGNPSVPSIGGPTLSKNPEVKYSCTMEFGRHLHGGTSSLGNVQHNHTYSLPPESSGTMQRPLSRDKSKGKKSEEEPHLTRDEKKARALSVPLSVDDIINLPMDEFNERLSKYDLSETQLSLIRDIRRRGKNKVAAQNCRKRKLDQILSLADEVKDMKDRKIRLLTEREFMLAEKQRVKEKFAQLYRHVFQHLRDPEGNLYSPTHYSLQQSADGSVLVVPRNNSTMQTHPDHKDPNNCKEQQ